MKDLSIIIVNWNTRELLKSCLNSINKETTKYTYDIWVIDNASTDGSAEMVKDFFPDVKIIANKSNHGFAAANNQALRQAVSKYYLLLNPDTLIINNAIDRLMDETILNNFHAVTCKLLNDDMTHQNSVNNFFSLTNSFINNRLFSLKNNYEPKDKNQKVIDWAHGAVLLFSITLFQKVGFLDERFYIYGEEIDYYMRLKKSGFTAVYMNNIEIIHYGRASSRQRAYEMFIQNYKSFYIFLKKHYKSHVYYIYRLRVSFYLPIWYLIFSISSIGQKIFRLKKEYVNNKKLYSRTIKWHLTKESFINL